MKCKVKNAKYPAEVPEVYSCSWDLKAKRRNTQNPQMTELLKLSRFGSPKQAPKSKYVERLSMSCMLSESFVRSEVVCFSRRTEDQNTLLRRVSRLLDLHGTTHCCIHGSLACRWDLLHLPVLFGSLQVLHVCSWHWFLELCSSLNWLSLCAMLCMSGRMFACVCVCVCVSVCARAWVMWTQHQLL